MIRERTGGRQTDFYNCTHARHKIGVTTPKSLSIIMLKLTRLHINMNIAFGKRYVNI
jgi:hypothetical protein